MAGIANLWKPRRATKVFGIVRNVALVAMCIVIEQAMKNGIFWFDHSKITLDMCVSDTYYTHPSRQILETIMSRKSDTNKDRAIRDFSPEAFLHS